MALSERTKVVSKICKSVLKELKQVRDREYFISGIRKNDVLPYVVKHCAGTDINPEVICAILGSYNPVPTIKTDAA